MDRLMGWNREVIMRILVEEKKGIPKLQNARKDLLP